MNQNENSINPAAPVDSNSMLPSALLAGAALGGAALLTGSKAARAQSGSVDLDFDDIPGRTKDIKVLNYALALEALEADLYRQAEERLQSLGQANTPLGFYVREFGIVEAQHRDFLIGAIRAANGTPITESLLNGATFDFGDNLQSANSILDFLIVVEDTGTSAYLGAIPEFGTFTYLQAAAAIQGTEARHTSALIVLRNEDRGPSAVPGVYYTPLPAPAFDEGFANAGIDLSVSPDTVLGIVSPFIVPAS